VASVTAVITGRVFGGGIMADAVVLSIMLINYDAKAVCGPVDDRGLKYDTGIGIVGDTILPAFRDDTISYHYLAGDNG